MGGPEDRYGYAGAWGYQTHDFPSGDPIPFVHVGARYYDPASGRFLQRDPIGIRGGLNVYLYLGNQPTMGADPSGQGWWYDFSRGRNRFHQWFAEKFWMHPKNPVEPRLPKMGDAEAAGIAIGCSIVGGVVIYFGGKYIILRLLKPRPYPVGPPQPPGPHVPPPIWPGDDHVVPSKPPNLPDTPPEYDPDEPWPT
jgi:RHS repeat-associated protein